MIVEHEHAGVNEPRNSKKRWAKKTSNWNLAPLLVSWAHATSWSSSWSWSWSEGWAQIEWVRAELNYWFISCPWMLLPAKSWTISLCRSRLTSAQFAHSHDLLAFISLLLLYYFCISVFCISFSRLDVFFGRRLRGGLSTTLRALFAFFDCFDCFEC